MFAWFVSCLMFVLHVFACVIFAWHHGCMFCDCMFCDCMFLLAWFCFHEFVCMIWFADLDLILHCKYWNLSHEIIFFWSVCKIKDVVGWIAWNCVVNRSSEIVFLIDLDLYGWLLRFQHSNMASSSRVQVWVGARKSRAGSLSDLREIVTNGSFAWSVEDHGYNVGHLIEICGCILLFLHVFLVF